MTTNPTNQHTASWPDATRPALPPHAASRTEPTILTIANGGGSAGKTTTAVTLAALHARTGHRVLVVDADGQGTATTWLGVDQTPDMPNLGHVLLKQADASQAIVASTTPGVDVLPATPAFTGLVMQLNGLVGKDMALKTALHHVTGYDLILIDCPGDINIITTAAILAATRILTTTFAEDKEIQGIVRLIATITELADAYTHLSLTAHLDAIVPCSVPAANRGTYYVNALDFLHTQDWDATVTNPVRQSVRVPESRTARQPLPDYSPTEAVTDDYPGERPWEFTGGSIRQVQVNVSGKPYVDLEREAVAMMARE